MEDLLSREKTTECSWKIIQEIQSIFKLFNRQLLSTVILKTQA